MSSSTLELIQPPLSTSAGFVAGVDIGGTYIKVGILDRHAQVHHRLQLASEAARGFEHFVARIGETVVRAVAEAGLAMSDLVGVGVGYPGTVHLDTGRISGSPNIPGANGSNLIAPLIERFGKAVVVANDASAAALGECLYGAGRIHAARHLVLFTLGTGVGGGVVVDGQLVKGAHHQGSELGHMIVDPNGPLCGCGNFGCLESYCGTAGILRSAWTRLQSGRESLLWEKIRAFERPELTPRMISEAAAAGDAVALEVWAEIGYWLGVGCVTCINFVDPEVIVIGGQIAKAGAPLFDAIQRTVRARQRLNPWPVERIVPAALGEDAGIIGSAAGVLQALAV
jgi:glucokinase